MEKIADRLKKLRERKGLTQIRLAKLAKIPVSTYRDWEGGKAITGEPYAVLAKLLDVSIGYLITGEHIVANSLLFDIDKIIEDVKSLRKNVIAFYQDV